MKKYQGKLKYPYVLDHKPAFFISSLLYRLFKKVNLDENMKQALKDMQRKGTVVYAIKYRGLLEYLLYHYTFRNRRLPYPKIAFDINVSIVLPLRKLAGVIFSNISALFKYGKIPSPYKTGYFASAIKRRTPALISLLDPEGFTKAFIHSEKDHLYFLLEIQRNMDRPIFIVPQLIIYKKSAEKDTRSLTNILFGYKDQIGLLRKIILFSRHYSTTFIDFGTPINLKEYLDAQPVDRSLDEMSSEIKQLLIESIDSQKRIILGPIMKSRQQLKEIVLRDEKVNAQIEKIAEGDPKQLKLKRIKAGKYFDEIAADYNSTYVGFFWLALKYLWKRLFEGIDVDQAGAAKVREWARKGTLIYIPSHKSHIDYLILNYILYESQVHIPRIAAGQNLTFWPMGHIFRKSGAFFIRRSFRGAKLYMEVFSRYIKAMLEEGHPIQFYIEGGRSRNGKLVRPKMGFLSILLNAHKEGFCKDLIFVPTSIIYDRIIEENAYLKEIGGGKKQKESFKQFLKARHFLKRKYGKVYIRFNEPFSLNEYLRKKENDEKDVLRDLAFDLINSINEVSLVTPLSLIATAILSNHRKGFYISELQNTVDILLNFLKTYNVPLASTLNDPTKAVQDTISLLIGWKIMDQMEDTPWEEETFYFVEEDKKMELEYYKNNIIHFFIHHSFVAISFLSNVEEKKTLESIISDYVDLREYLKDEFNFDDREDINNKVQSIIDYFSEVGLVSQSGTDGYQITKPGFSRMPIWASLAKTFIESYWITAQALGMGRDVSGTGEALLKRISYMGRRYHKLGTIEHVESLSQINFKNAVSLINRSMFNSDDKGEGEQPDFERISHFTKRLYDFSHYG